MMNILLGQILPVYYISCNVSIDSCLNKRTRQDYLFLVFFGIYIFLYLRTFSVWVTSFVDIVLSIPFRKFKLTPIEHIECNWSFEGNQACYCLKNKSHIDMKHFLPIIDNLQTSLWAWQEVYPVLHWPMMPSGCIWPYAVFCHEENVPSDHVEMTWSSMTVHISFYGVSILPQRICELIIPRGFKSF